VSVETVKSGDPRGLPTSGGAGTQCVNVIPLRECADLCGFFAPHFAAEWPDWYGPGRRGDAVADLDACANRAGQLPLGVVAVDAGGAPIGIAALKPTSIDTYTHVGPWAVAGYIIPDRRRGGVGALLLSALSVEACRLGFQAIYCATVGAASLLEREGWRQIDAVAHDGGTQRIFRRTLPGPG